VNPREAEELLEEAELVPVAQASLPEAKRLLEECLAADIPVLLGRDDHCTSGCSPTLMLMTRGEDAPRVVELMRARWRSLVELEGTLAEAGGATGEGEMPCPACGTAVPDDAAECPDCGLVV